MTDEPRDSGVGAVSRKPARASGPGRKPERSAGARRPDRRRIWTFVAIAIIVLVSLARAIHLQFPLERDEGEFGYIAQQLLHGVPVYLSAYTQKLPGAYYVYAWFLLLFGQSTVGIHLGFLLTNAATMALVFLIGRKIHGGLAGCAGALVYGVMALSPALLGASGHATHLIAFFSVLGLYALLEARERGRLWLYLVSGLSFGMAFLSKQSAVFYAPLIVAYLALEALRLEPARRAGFPARAGAFVAGAAAPMVLTLAYYAAIGHLGTLWYWSFQLARQFGEQVGFSGAMANLRDRTREVTAGFVIVWLVGAVGLGVMLRDRSLGALRYLILAFGLAAILSIVPGYFFTTHYYIAVLPFLAILVGGLLDVVARGRGERGPSSVGTAAIGAALAIGLSVGVVRYEPFYSGRMPDAAAARIIYSGNPFPESVEVGQYLREHTSPGDSIAVLGSETQIYFYAQRPSASRFVNAYFLTSDHPKARDMQLMMIRDLDRVRPKYLVYTNSRLSWTLHETSPRDIFDWYQAAKKDYAVDGVVDIGPNASTSIWGPAAASAPLGTEYFEVLKRRN
ncbi:MAG TPA: glycosyltransferase family 39 protein [Candidatus Eisenbacteria bacterium]|nr:glycosyltransferase family 39 protein [Candidatus Eisenbacteria bacterium]